MILEEKDIVVICEKNDTVVTLRKRYCGGLEKKDIVVICEKNDTVVTLRKGYCGGLEKRDIVVIQGGHLQIILDRRNIF